MVQLLLEDGSDVSASLQVLIPITARETATSNGHAAVAQLIAESEEARVVARQGDVELFRAQVEAAVLSAPLLQWVPAMPAAARAALAAWASESVRDSAACFAALFAPLAEPPSLQADLLRECVGHDGVVGVRRLIVSFLVHHKAGTRRVLRELAAIGDLGAGAGDEAVSDTTVAAAARRAAKVRAMWA